MTVNYREIKKKNQCFVDAVFVDETLWCDFFGGDFSPVLCLLLLFYVSLSVANTLGE